MAAARGPWVPLFLAPGLGEEGTLAVLKDYGNQFGNDSSVAVFAVLYHAWQWLLSHILLSRLLRTQPSGLHSPTDSSSWQRNDRAVWYP